ncbi:hypothetical protein F5Y19DRAFT_183584 [Xylariaceae sp. FL1651]|nr:hypothetical protein F5Y19DRAFT_183584 [Xylariaceae sp. FL1651]
MSFNAGARLVRVQPTVLHHGAPFVPVIPLLLSVGSRQYTVARIAPLSTFTSSNNLSRTFSRTASTSSAAQTKTPNSSSSASSTATALTTSDEKQFPSEPSPFSDTLNPPASTRPPPLDLPVRDPQSNLFGHLFRLGKAYTTFYKTGLKAVFTNRRLLRDLPDTPPPNLPSGIPTVPTSAPTPTTAAAALSPDPRDKVTLPTRASLLLRSRVRHDTARLPLFGLVVLICGEFTPLVVLLFPRLTPYTCRIPAQATVIRRGAEARRAASFRALSHVADDAAALDKVADGHICRSLGLGSALWDKAGLDVPVVRSRAAGAVGRIVRDDAMLRDGGGAGTLVDDEVVLACEERGIDTLEKDTAALRQELERWLVKSAPTEKRDVEAAVKESSDKVKRLLLGRDV